MSGTSGKCERESGKLGNVREIRQVPTKFWISNFAALTPLYPPYNTCLHGFKILNIVRETGKYASGKPGNVREIPKAWQP